MMTTLTVYDPAMCCSTGICGPEIDPRLIAFASDLDWLKTRGIAVTRINLAQEPARFLEHAEVKAVLDRSGGEELPVILIDGRMAASGRYPDRRELAAMVDVQIDAAIVNEGPPTRASSCCGSASAGNKVEKSGFC